MSRRISAGVVGTGRLGSLHARLLACDPAFEFAGVYDRSEERAAEVAGRFSAERFDTAADLYDQVAAVVVAVPAQAHHEEAAAAIAAGCHVLVEKPLASSLEEADDLVRRAEAQGVVLGVGHVERFNGVLIAAEPYMDRPRFIESVRMAPFQPRGADVTVVLDLMIHDIDLVLSLVDAPVADVQAAGASAISSSIDMANARLSFEDGTVATITASRVAFKALRQLRLFQRSGYFSLDLAGGTGHHYRRRADARADARAGGSVDTIDAWVERVPLQGGADEPLGLEIAAFAAAIDGRPNRLVSGRAGRDALKIAIDINRKIEEFVDVVAQDS